MASDRPVLFYDEISPPVRSCLILAKYIQIDLDLKHLDLLTGEKLNPEFLKLNPAHTVPTLKHGDLILTDSHVIMIYFCEKFGKKFNLYPHDNEIDRLKVLNKVFFEACILFRIDRDLWLDVYKTNLERLKKHKTKLCEVYSMMESFLKNSKFMAGEKITIADLSMATTLSSVVILVPLEQDKWPKLVKWLTELYSFPHFLQVNEPGLAKLKASVKKYANIDIPFKI